MSNNLPEKPKKVFKINTDSPYYYLGVLAVALLVFGFSFWQAQSSIKKPFAIGAERYNIEQPVTSEIDLNDVETLKKLDTDKDNLSDYLEIYVYGTSAYIEDTDSDGLLDGAEVVSGNNPLCGQAEGCTSESIIAPASNTTNSLLALYSSEEQLRQGLMQLGFTEADLAPLSQQDMMELYEQTNNLLQTQPESFQQEAISTLYNLTPNEVRALLIEDGASEIDLATISDEQLMEMYTQALQDNSSQ